MSSGTTSRISSLYEVTQVSPHIASSAAAKIQPSLAHSSPSLFTCATTSFSGQSAPLLTVTVVPPPVLDATAHSIGGDANTSNSNTTHSSLGWTSPCFTSTSTSSPSFCIKATHTSASAGYCAGTVHHRRRHTQKSLYATSPAALLSSPPSSLTSNAVPYLTAVLPTKTSGIRACSIPQRRIFVTVMIFFSIVLAALMLLAACGVSVDDILQSAPSGGDGGERGEMSSGGDRGKEGTYRRRRAVWKPRTRGTLTGPTPITLIMTSSFQVSKAAYVEFAEDDGGAATAAAAAGVGGLTDLLLPLINAEGALCFQRALLSSNTTTVMKSAAEVTEHIKRGNAHRVAETTDDASPPVGVVHKQQQRQRQKGSMQPALLPSPPPFVLHTILVTNLPASVVAPMLNGRSGLQEVLVDEGGLGGAWRAWSLNTEPLRRIATMPEAARRCFADVITVVAVDDGNLRRLRSSRGGMASHPEVRRGGAAGKGSGSTSRDEGAHVRRLRRYQDGPGGWSFLPARTFAESTASSWTKLVPLEELVDAALRTAAGRAGYYFISLLSNIIPTAAPYTLPGDAEELRHAPTGFVDAMLQALGHARPNIDPARSTSAAPGATAEDRWQYDQPCVAAVQCVVTEPTSSFASTTAATGRYGEDGMQSRSIPIPLRHIHLNHLTVRDAGGVIGSTTYNNAALLYYLHRRHSGMRASDQRVLWESAVDTASLACGAFHRGMFDLVGGFAAALHPGMDDEIDGGDCNGSTSARAARNAGGVGARRDEQDGAVRVANVARTYRRLSTGERNTELNTGDDNANDEDGDEDEDGEEQQYTRDMGRLIHSAGDSAGWKLSLRLKTLYPQWTIRTSRAIGVWVSSRYNSDDALRRNPSLTRREEGLQHARGREDNANTKMQPEEEEVDEETGEVLRRRAAQVRRQRRLLTSRFPTLYQHFCPDGDLAVPLYGLHDWYGRAVASVLALLQRRRSGVPWGQRERADRCAADDATHAVELSHRLANDIGTLSATAGAKSRSTSSSTGVPGDFVNASGRHFATPRAASQSTSFIDTTATTTTTSIAGSTNKASAAASFFSIEAQSAVADFFISSTPPILDFYADYTCVCCGLNKQINGYMRPLMERYTITAVESDDAMPNGDARSPTNTRGVCAQPNMDMLLMAYRQHHFTVFGVRLSWRAQAFWAAQHRTRSHVSFLHTRAHHYQRHLHVVEVRRAAGLSRTPLQGTPASVAEEFSRHKSNAPHIPPLAFTIGYSLTEFSSLPHEWLAPLRGGRGDMNGTPLTSNFSANSGSGGAAETTDQVWVPSLFFRDLYTFSGVAPERVRVMPEAVDVFLFDPANVAPLPFYALANPSAFPAVAVATAAATPSQAAAFPISSHHHSVAPGYQEAHDAATGIWDTHPHLSTQDRHDRFVFLSVFKFEHRKGWDVLLSAYWDAFGPGAPLHFRNKTTLILKVSFNPPSTLPLTAHGLESYLTAWATRRIPSSTSISSQKRWGGGPFAEAGNNAQARGRVSDGSISSSSLMLPGFNSTFADSFFPHLIVIDSEYTEVDMARLYATADAFVLPSRAEGWGLPVAEAMSMALPCIVTDWGGLTSFTRVGEGANSVSSRINTNTTTAADTTVAAAEGHARSSLPHEVRDENLTTQTAEDMDTETVTNAAGTCFPIPIDGLEELPPEAAAVYGAATGKRWAKPSRKRTSQLMQYVVEHREHARQVGRRARQFAVMHLSEEAVADVMDGYIYRTLFDMMNASLASM